MFYAFQLGDKIDAVNVICESDAFLLQSVGSIHRCFDNVHLVKLNYPSESLLDARVSCFVHKAVCIVKVEQIIILGEAHVEVLDQSRLL